MDFSVTDSCQSLALTGFRTQQIYLGPVLSDCIVSPYSQLPDFWSESLQQASHPSL